MKSIHKCKYPVIICLICALVSCDKNITDFGFDASIAGVMKEASGKIVPGDITSNNLVVKSLAEGDEVATDIRVRGDGTFSNYKIYPSRHKIWIEGPVYTLDTINVDLSGGKSFIQDIAVIPYITIKPPTILGTPTSSSVYINYDITANKGRTIAKRSIFCSTSPYPTSSTGSGAYYTTITTSVNDNIGIASVTGLVADTKYYLRIGAQAAGQTGWNYSEQLIFNTPAE